MAKVTATPPKAVTNPNVGATATKAIETVTNPLLMALRPEAPTNTGKGPQGVVKSILPVVEAMRQTPSYHNRDNGADGWYLLRAFDKLQAASVAQQKLKELVKDFEFRQNADKEAKSSKLYIRYKIETEEVTEEAAA